MLFGQNPVVDARQDIQQIAQSEGKPKPPHAGPERRRHPRWSISGSCEISLPSVGSSEIWMAELRDISESGLGVTCSHYFDPETVVELLVHTGGTSFAAEANVRYCHRVRGEFNIGLEFIFREQW